MPSNQIEQKRIETYAKVLLEASRAKGREAVDLEILEAMSHLPSEILSLLQVMGENDDLGYIAQVADVYRDSKKDVVTAEVTTAVELTDELRKHIQDKLQADLGKEVYLVEKVDPSILGGLIICCGDQRRDVSLKRQLESIRSTLGEAILAGGDK